METCHFAPSEGSQKRQFSPTGLLLTRNTFGPEHKVEELCGAGDRSSSECWSFGESIAVKLANF